MVQIIGFELGIYEIAFAIAIFIVLWGLTVLFIYRKAREKRLTSDRLINKFTEETQNVSRSQIVSSFMSATEEPVNLEQLHQKTLEALTKQIKH